MKQLVFLFFYFLLLQLSPEVVGQTPAPRMSTPDSTYQTESAAVVADEPAPETTLYTSLRSVLFLGMAVLFVFILGAGIALSVIGVLVLFGAVAFGLVSVSVLVGVHQKSVGKGCKTFLLFTGAGTGAFVGALSFYLLHILLDQSHSLGLYLSVGGVGGFLAGTATALVTYTILRRLTAYLLSRLKTI